jgi:hypothetical protein
LRRPAAGIVPARLTVMRLLFRQLPWLSLVSCLAHAGCQADPMETADTDQGDEAAVSSLRAAHIPLAPLAKGGETRILIELKAPATISISGKKLPKTTMFDEDTGVRVEPASAGSYVISGAATRRFEITLANSGERVTDLVLDVVSKKGIALDIDPQTTRPLQIQLERDGGHPHKGGITASFIDVGTDEPIELATKSTTKERGSAVIELTKGALDLSEEALAEPSLVMDVTIGNQDTSSLAAPRFLLLARSDAVEKNVSGTACDHPLSDGPALDCGAGYVCSIGCDVDVGELCSDVCARWYVP